MFPDPNVRGKLPRPSGSEVSEDPRAWEKLARFRLWDIGWKPFDEWALEQGLSCNGDAWHRVATRTIRLTAAALVVDARRDEHWLHLRGWGRAATVDAQVETGRRPVAPDAGRPAVRPVRAVRNGEGSTGSLSDTTDRNFSRPLAYGGHRGRDAVTRQREQIDLTLAALPIAMREATPRFEARRRHVRLRFPCKAAPTERPAGECRFARVAEAYGAAQVAPSRGDLRKCERRQVRRLRAGRAGRYPRRAIARPAGYEGEVDDERVYESSNPGRVGADPADRSGGRATCTRSSSRAKSRAVPCSRSTASSARAAARRRTSIWRRMQLFAITSGSITFTAGSDTRTVSAGESVFVPRATRHSYRNEEPTPARMIAVYTPAGMEGSVP